MSVIYQVLKNDALIKTAKTELPGNGTLVQNQDGYAYLRLNDDYIHRLFPLIQESNKKLPSYFSSFPLDIGAHISVLYPDELKSIPRLQEVGNLYKFEIGEFCLATVREKSYFILRVGCPQLISLRVKYDLKRPLNFHGEEVDFHITLGTTCFSS